MATVRGTRRQPSAHDPLSPRLRELDTIVERGVLAGTASAVPTVLLLMLGGALVGVGPWVPFYSIVALFDPNALVSAQAALDEGFAPDFYQLEFVGGLATALALGAVSGVVFSWGTRRHEVDGWARWVLGAAHGVVMMCLFYLVVLTALSAVIDDPQNLAHSLSRQVGWPVLIVAHVVHGLVLAWLIRSRAITTRSPFEHLTPRSRD